MYNRNQFLDKSAKGVLENHKREAEERKLQLAREQRARDLKKLETDLFYKKEEVARLKAQFERLRREAVVRQSTANKEKNELADGQRKLKETQERLQTLDQGVTRMLSDVTNKIEKEKAVIAEHERKLAELERQKKDIESGQGAQKKTVSESVSRLLFFKKKEEREAQKAETLFAANQTQLHGIEQSLKKFSQEVAVLENKIRALRNSHL